MHATAPAPNLGPRPAAFLSSEASMYRWFETLIDPFPDEPPARPPEGLLAFYVYFIKPVWPAFAV